MSRNKSGRPAGDRRNVSQLKHKVTELEHELEKGQPLGLAKSSRLREQLNQLRNMLLPPDDVAAT